MEISAPLPEHQWLQQFLGEWTFEGECSMGQGQPIEKSCGTETVRSLGTLWTIGEAEGEMPTGGLCRSVITLGFDPQTGRFVGSFIASVMTRLWVYDGSLDAARNILTLNTEGPSFAGDGTLAKYQDIFQFISPDRRTMTSRMQGKDGEWTQFMRAVYRRKT